MQTQQKKSDQEIFARYFEVRLPDNTEIGKFYGANTLNAVKSFTANAISDVKKKMNAIYNTRAEESDGSQEESSESASHEETEKKETREYFNEIWPGTYLGGFPWIETIDALQALHPGKTITFITILELWEMTMANMVAPVDYEKRGCKQFYLPWQDNAGEISLHMEMENIFKIMKYIEEARKRGEVVYIQCKAGKARSSIIEAIDLVINNQVPGKTTGEQLKNAVKKIKKIRPQIDLHEDRLNALSPDWDKLLSNPTKDIKKKAAKLYVAYQFIEQYEQLKKNYSKPASTASSSSSSTQTTYSLNTEDFYNQLVQSRQFKELALFMIREPGENRATYLRDWFNQIHKEIKTDGSPVMPRWFDEFMKTIDTIKTSNNARYRLRTESKPTPIGLFMTNESLQNDQGLIISIISLYQSITQYQKCGILTTQTNPFLLHLMEADFQPELAQTFAFMDSLIKRFKSTLLAHLDERQRFGVSEQAVMKQMIENMNSFNLIKNVFTALFFCRDYLETNETEIAPTMYKKLEECGYPFGAILYAASEHSLSDTRTIKDGFEHLYTTLITRSACTDLLKKQGFDLAKCPELDVDFYNRKSYVPLRTSVPIPATTAPTPASTLPSSTASTSSVQPQPQPTAEELKKRKEAEDKWDAENQEKVKAYRAKQKQRKNTVSQADDALFSVKPSTPTANESNQTPKPDKN